jgi:hypothetical protein
MHSIFLKFCCGSVVPAYSGWLPFAIVSSWTEIIKRKSICVDIRFVIGHSRGRMTFGSAETATPTISRTLKVLA